MTHDIGVQSYTYREFSIDEICDALADTPVSAIELYGGHVDLDGALETATRLEPAMEVRA
ncbi:hypothetical protein [Halomontanus rarus]|uniref:hypothetical protein n=1 Tax=Halomontanus rarus TaxID=3034020 RepID=UPI001A994B48